MYDELDKIESDEAVEEETPSVERITSMLIAIGVNHLQSTYEASQKRLREEFYNLPAPDVLKTWEWLSDHSKLKVIDAKRDLFNAAVKEIIQKESL